MALTADVPYPILFGLADKVVEAVRPYLYAQNIKGVYACSHCDNAEIKEREVKCWKCGKGDMIYHRISPDELKEEAKKNGTSLCEDRNCAVLGSHFHLYQFGETSTAGGDWSIPDGINPVMGRIMKTAKHLKPCPFCGSDPHYGGFPDVRIECKKCKQAIVKAAWYDGNLGTTEAAWNTRNG